MAGRVKVAVCQVADTIYKTVNEYPNYRRVGLAGRERLKKVMWSSSRAEDVASLRDFMGGHFP